VIDGFFKRRPDSAENKKAPGHVAADALRCVQCGVCGYNCPMGIDVRSHARQGLSIINSGCLECGVCIAVCPRGTLRWDEGQQ
jgi:heterodisulfide reductase subunit C